MEQRVCADCGITVTWARLKCRGCFHNFGPPTDPDPTTCPKCGSQDIADLGKQWDDLTFFCEGCGPGRIGYRASVRYPYFDRGLNREILSPGHRREVCRELGVIPTDGETRGLWDEIADKAEAEDERIDRKYAEYMDEMTTGPARGEFARLQEHMKEVHREEFARAREEDAQGRRQWEREVEAMQRARRDARR